MINIFVTYKCNLDCPYCFAGELKREHPGYMEPEAFARLLAWMKRSGLPTAGFIGGEPTLHPALPEMIEAATAQGTAAVLFTNGLFSPDLADRLAPLVSNFVVNHNDPSTYTRGQARLFHRNLERLSRLGARLTFSKNFTLSSRDYGPLIEDAKRYGVRNVRYDLSRPSGSGENEHVGLDETRGLLEHIVSFVLSCEGAGIRTGLDCCLRLCDLSGVDRRYLERVSMKFTGICHPSMDIHPDLSASYCLPMRHVSVPDVTAFANSERLMERFSEMVGPVRFDNVSEECSRCPDFRRACQGGCMALKRPPRPDTVPAGRETKERGHERA